MAASIPAFAPPIQGPVEVDLPTYAVGAAVVRCADGREVPETAAAGAPALGETAAFGFRPRTNRVDSTFSKFLGAELRITTPSRVGVGLCTKCRTARNFCFVCHKKSTGDPITREPYIDHFKSNGDML
jgi:hypothetical protein